jgi:phage shock protein A
MRRTVADVATSRKRIELHAQQLQQSAAKLDGQAKQAILHYKFQRRAEQLPQRLLSRLAKSWRAWQADILTRHVNGGCSNGCTERSTC